MESTKIVGKIKSDSVYDPIYFADITECGKKVDLRLDHLGTYYVAELARLYQSNEIQWIKVITHKKCV